MVSHIVMWKFKEEIREQDKPELKRAMKENLEGLVGVVPGLAEARFIEFPISSSTHDMALVTRLESEEALKGYGTHPEHVKVADTYVRPYVHNRSCLDYQE